jgi:hypothetical protein
MKIIRSLLKPSNAAEGRSETVKMYERRKRLIRSCSILLRDIRAVLSYMSFNVLAQLLLHTHPRQLDARLVGPVISQRDATPGKPSLILTPLQEESPDR